MRPLGNSRELFRRTRLRVNELARRAWICIANAITSLASICLTLRIPLIVAAFSYFIFASPAQMQELYLILAGDPLQNLLKIVVPTVVVVLLVKSLDGYCFQALIERGRPIGKLQGLCLGIIAAMPAIGIATGLHRASSYFEMKDLQEVFVRLEEKPLTPAGADYIESLTSGLPGLHDLTLGTLRVLEVTSLLLGASAAMFSLLGVIKRTEHPLAGITIWMQRNIFAITAMLVLAGSAQTFSGLAGIPHLLIRGIASVGALTWIALFLFILLLFLARLQQMSRGAGMYFVAVLVVMSVLFDWFGLNDNHIIRTIPAAGKGNSLLVTDEFDEWWRQRPKEKVEAFNKLGRPFPVYVVAARGGGLYAAYQTAIVLGRLYDACPAILDHLFLISSVSGGSLGAAAFVSAVKDGPTRKSDECSFARPSSSGMAEALLDRYFSSDFLSPLVASALFPDFAQRFLPYPIMAFDRARAFERGLEAAWRSATSGTSNAFGEGIVKRHRRGRDPVIYMNVTQAETGEQHVIAPTSDAIEWNRSSVTSAYPQIADPNRGTDLALSTAVTLSARFTLIMPPGSVRADTDTFSFWPIVSTRYVDGGYFENSGADTAVNIISSARSSAKCRLGFVAHSRPLTPRGRMFAGDADSRDGVCRRFDRCVRNDQLRFGK